MKTLLEFLARRGFVVITKGNQEYEAWAYEGPLDFESATPVRFGLGNTPVDSLNALDWQLGVLAKATPAPMVPRQAPSPCRLNKGLTTAGGKTNELPCCGITVTLGPRDPQSPGAYLGGTITSQDLRGGKTKQAHAGPYNAAVDVLEAFILASACAGIDIADTAFVEAVNTVTDKILEEYG